MTRRIAGQRAKRNGDYFENLIMFFANHAKFNFIKIPSGCKTVGTKLIRVKSPFDFILVRNDWTIFCDAKSTNGNTFSYSMIDQDQVRNLTLVNTDKNCSGYIINFNGEVYFAPVILLRSIKPRQSLSRDFCLPMGDIKNINFDFLDGVSTSGKSVDFDSSILGSNPSTPTKKVKNGKKNSASK